MMKSTHATARLAGAIYFPFMILGIISEFVLPAFLVSGDAAATASGIVAGESLYRAGVLLDVFTLVVFIVLVGVLFELFRTVHKFQTMLMVSFALTGILIAFANLHSKLDALLFATGGDVFSGFSKLQLDALAYGFLKGYHRYSYISMMFWGLWLFPFGVLVNKSGWFPKWLGYCLFAAGVGYAITSVVAIIAPQHSQLAFKIMTPLYLGEVPIIFWLLLKGAPGAVTAAKTD